MRVPLAPCPCQHLELSTLDFSHFDKCAVVSYCCLIWTSLMTAFHACHLRIFFGEVSVRVLCAFLIEWFIFLCLKKSLYILDNSPSSGMSFANIFSQSTVYRFHSLNSVFGRAEVFNFNEVQFINIFFHEAENFSVREVWLISSYLHGSCLSCLIWKVVASSRHLEFVCVAFRSNVAFPTVLPLFLHEWSADYFWLSLLSQGSVCPFFPNVTQSWSVEL